MSIIHFWSMAFYLHVGAPLFMEQKMEIDSVARASSHVVETVPSRQAKQVAPHQTQSARRATPSYTASSSAKTPILFVHFHKSGGSSVCWTMSLAIMITNANGTKAGPRKNCNTPFSGPNANVQQHREEQICQNLHSYTDDKHNVTRVNFVAIEVALSRCHALSRLSILCCYAASNHTTTITHESSEMECKSYC